MKKSENFFQKMFAGIGFVGSSRIPIRSNIYKSGRGYSKIGQTGKKMFDMDRNSPLLGTAQPSNRLSGYYDRVAELKGYQLLDITKLSVGLFRDYVINFLIKESQELVTIQNEDGSNNENATERINSILTKDIKLLEFIEDHVDDCIFFGTYCAMLVSYKNETGHTAFRVEELYDPVSVVTKRKKNSEKVIEDVFIARGEDGSLYEIPRNRAFRIGSTNLRLINDLEEGWDEAAGKSQKTTFSKDSSNLDKVLKKESYVTGEPLFYSSVLKVKELVIKELLISLLSLRDLSSPSLYGLSIDNGVPLEKANELCARIQRMSTNSNELASFLTAQFDSTSFIESALTQNVMFFPDYNGTLSNKNSMLPLDKLSDKLLDLLQTLDQCRQNVLSPLGIPASVFDSTAGSKWAILQQSERANSRVSTLMSGIDSSVIDLTCSIYRELYNEEIDPSLIKTHIFERSTVEYNNQINQSESINSLVQGITNVITTALQTLDTAGPLMEPEKFLAYVQNLIKDIDPTAGALITEQSIAEYAEIQRMKIQQQKEQFGG